ncbi:MAG: hypothetical protein WD969_10405 [Paracoccaceae bacterium]
MAFRSVLSSDISKRTLPLGSRTQSVFEDRVSNVCFHFFYFFYFFRILSPDFLVFLDALRVFIKITSSLLAQTTDSAGGDQVAEEVGAGFPAAVLRPDAPTSEPN